MALTDCLHRLWYGNTPLARVVSSSLLPLSAVFAYVANTRRLQMQRTSSDSLGCPIIVVGNLTVGGTGKTPLVIALVQYLREQGLRVGIVSRGYGGKTSYPHKVTAHDPAVTGDEAALFFRHCDAPIVIDPNRVNAARSLLAQHPVDVIVSDDGLQHKPLPKDFTIAVVDGQRGFGNGRCLPAGPLREPVSSLRYVNACVVNQSTVGQLPSGVVTQCQQYAVTVAMKLVISQPKPLAGTPLTSPPRAGDTVHAVAGIGNPQRFFDTLSNLGYQVIPHAFADHHAFDAADVRFDDELPVMMTEKDAVKCEAMADLANHWVLPVQASLPQTFYQSIIDTLALQPSSTLKGSLS